MKLVKITSLADTWHMVVSRYSAVQSDSHSLDSSHSGSVIEVKDQVIELEIMT